MDIPDDLTVDIRNRMIVLTSQGRSVEIANDGRNGPFVNGPIAWQSLKMIYLAPALDVLKHGLTSRPA